MGRSAADLSGRVVVVTGANSGLGLETSRALAARGATVWMACRDPRRGEAAASGVREAHPGADVRPIALDLADLSSVRSFPVRLASPVVDVLVNNAGIMAIPRSTTVDGFETQLGTNHLGHFALTAALADRLFDRPGARIVTVSSGMHWLGGLRREDLQLERSYGKWRAYNQSKLANLLFHHELSARLQAAGRAAVAVAAHPGFTATHLQQVGVDREPTLVNRALATVGNGLFAQPVRWGALPSLFAAADPRAMSGAYYGPWFEGWGPVRQAWCSRRSRDPELRSWLWAESARLVGADPLPDPGRLGP